MRIIGLYLSFIPFSIKKKTGMERETQHKKERFPSWKSGPIGTMCHHVVGDPSWAPHPTSPTP